VVYFCHLRLKAIVENLTATYIRRTEREHIPSQFISSAAVCTVLVKCTLLFGVSYI